MNRKKSAAHINALPFDMKAEFLVLNLLEQGATVNDLLMAFDGDLKRKWSTDVGSADVESFENGDETLTVHLNRMGIYDQLPEALFHDYPDKRNASGEEMAKDSMKLKAEEKRIRQFFRPLENELFYQNVRVAGREQSMIKEFYFAFINGLIPGFWKIDPNVPLKYREKLIKLLPLAHQITGNYRLTAKCLEKIISEKVRIEYLSDNFEIQIDRKKTESVSGAMRLGSNFVLSGKPTGWFGKVLIEIGPLKNSRISDFFDHGEIGCLMNCFIGYFIPVELDAEIRIVVDKKRVYFKLKSENEAGNALLGYNTVIQ